MGLRDPHFCARCGRKRGDGRRDRGWCYWIVDVHMQTERGLIGPVQVPVAFCAACWAFEIKPQFIHLETRDAS